MKRKQCAIFFSILLLIFFACTALWLWTDYPVTHIISESGERDLRGMDFSSGCFDLCGPVEYIPNALLTPEEFETRRGEIQTGEPAEVARFSTSRLRVRVHDGTYGLMMWNAEFATNIYLNGRLTESVGVPVGDSEHSVPGVRLIYFTTDAPDGVIEIVQQAANFVLPEGGSYADIIIGSPENIRDIYNQSRGIPSVAMGCFLTLALAHLILFSLFRSYKANLWFALFCFAWFLRTGYVNPWILSTLFPLPWDAVFRLDCLTYPAGTLLLCFSLNALFPGAHGRAASEICDQPRTIQKWFRIALSAACGLFACAGLFLGTAALWDVMSYFNAVIFLTAAYFLIRLCMKVRKPDAEQIAVLAGLGIFLFGVLRDILHFEIIPTLMKASPNMSELTRHTMAEYALLVFVFFHMAAMFRSTMREIAAARDAEQTLAMENALLAREATVREDMVRNLSHEVRTPLTVISTYTQLAVRQFRQEGKIDEQTIDGLDAVYEEAQRIAELATDTLSSKEKGDRIADLAEIARQLVRLYTPTAKAAGRTLNANLTKRLFTTCNVSEITQVIWNLLDNALKHGERGSIDVDGNRNDEYVYIIITDYGAGIAPGLLPDIFERGVSGGGGSGIGLSIAREIAQKHGGKLIIESEYGLGTVATLLLPGYRKKGG